MPSNTVMVKFQCGDVNIGGIDLHCKDVDNFITWFDEETVREYLLSFSDSHEEIDELIILSA